MVLSRLRSEATLIGLLRLCALLAGGVFLCIVIFSLREAWPALRDIGPARFVRDPSWHPRGGAGTGAFNLLPMLAGTLAATAGAMMLAVPLGLAAAGYGVFYASAPVSKALRRLLELLAGVPSVVFGFWGLTTLVPLIRAWQPPGHSLLAGILILALMILPTIALLTESALRSVPRELTDGAAALGLTRWAALCRVAFPAASRGVGAGILLACARALGETMAVLMVTGNVVRAPGSVFDPVRTLTANIALELGYALPLHRSALFVAGMVLLTLILIPTFLARISERRRSREA